MFGGDGEDVAWNQVVQFGTAAAPGYIIRQAQHAPGPHPRDPKMVSLTGNGGLPDVAVSDLAVDTRDATGRTVYAATDLGVYRTVDGGDSWTLFGAGLPNVSVRSLYLSPEGEFLRIATYGRGVWEVELGN